MSNSHSTAHALFILRLTIFILMIVWAVLKIVEPGAYAGAGDNPGILQKFYGISAGVNIVYAIGALQIVLLVAYVLGFFKTITIGVVMLMNLSSLLVSMPKIIEPLAEKGNLLFVAAIPVFGASLAHFLMRREDTYLSLGK